VHRSLSLRIATLLLVASMAAPAMAAPRDDSPFDRFERSISKIISHIILDLENALQPPR
jgi:hypothetical protein